MFTSLSPLIPAEPVFYAVGLVATLLIAVGKGAFGGGLAILGIPLMALAVPPVEAAIIIAILVFAMDIFALRSFGRANWSRPDLKGLLPGLVTGIGLGWLAFERVDPRWLALAIGAVTLAFAAHFFLRRGQAGASLPQASTPLALAAGTASGFTTFIAHAGGPPITLYLARRGLPKSVFAGTTVAFFTLGNLLKLPPYLVLGLDAPAALVKAALLLPACPVGVWMGRRLHDRLDQPRLMWWCYLLLTVAALKLTADAVRALA